MVLLAASVCTKAGKPLVSRQFVEMSRSRIEGLLSAFPKLMGSDVKSLRAGKSGNTTPQTTTAKQHTFVETESVRYVYQPLDQLYMLLITTKASNILEDLETLRLFSRVIPEYCHSMDEKEITENSFNLIFAFDEVVALGYRENVNLAQIRTFTEMESHEEKVYLEIKKSQERDARDKAKEKAKELATARKEMSKRGGIRGPASVMASGGYGPDTFKSEPSALGGNDSSRSYNTSSYNNSISKKPTAPSKAMRLGGKHRDVDSFVDQLQSEGQAVIGGGDHKKQASGGGPKKSIIDPELKTENVHIHTDEKVNLAVSRNGGVESLEVQGIMTVLIKEQDLQKVKIRVDNNDTKGAQLQTHPNLDKKAFLQGSMLTLKNPAKPMPLNTDVGVLKWRFQTQDEAFIPLSINCWPSETGSGCDVNIEYTLEMESLELNDVSIAVPVPPGSNPVINECDGDYRHERGRNLLVWSIPVIDSANKMGSLEFSVASAHPDNFFPVAVNFSSKTSQYCDIKPSEVITENDQPVKFSQDQTLLAEKYEIV